MAGKSPTLQHLGVRPAVASALHKASRSGRWADSLLLYPPRLGIGQPAADRVRLPWTGGEVEVWRSRPPTQPTGFIIHFNGNAECAEQNVEPMIRRWDGTGVELRLVNYPGYRGSSGPASLTLLLPSAMAVMHELGRTVGDRPILSGRSLGTAVALAVASRFPVSALLLHTPVPLRQIILGRFGWWNLWLGAGLIASQVPHELDAIENARHVHARMLVLLTLRDQLIPPTYQQRIIDAHAGQHRVVPLPGADHNDGLTPVEERELRRNLDWLLQPPHPGAGQKKTP